MVASDPKHFNSIDSSKITMGPFPTYKEKKIPLIYDNYISDLKINTPKGVIGRIPVKTKTKSWQILFSLHNYYKPDEKEQVDFMNLFQAAEKLGGENASEYFGQLGVPKDTPIKVIPTFNASNRLYPPGAYFFPEYAKNSDDQPTSKFKNYAPWPALFTDPTTDEDASIDSTNITERVSADAECQMFLLIRGWTLKPMDADQPGTGKIVEVRLKVEPRMIQIYPIVKPKKWSFSNLEAPGLMNLPTQETPDDEDAALEEEKVEVEEEEEEEEEEDDEEEEDEDE